MAARRARSSKRMRRIQKRVGLVLQVQIIVFCRTTWEAADLKKEG